MWIAKTPLRISFFGGGTDLPAFTEKEEGAALSGTISLYNYVLLNDVQRPLRFIHEQVTNGVENMRNDIAAACLKKYLYTNYDIVSLSDVHAVGAGLGGSSAFAMSLIHVLKKNLWPDEPITPEWLASETCKVEIDDCHYPIGIQDQYAMAYGGLNLWTFRNRKAEFRNSWGHGTAHKLSARLMLFYSGIPRTNTSGTILQNQQAVMRNDTTKFEMMKRIRDRAFTAENLLVWPNRMDEFGELLHENWMDKKQLTDDLSSKAFDEFYEYGLHQGAIGGKLLGAGGGGFFLFYVPVSVYRWAFAQEMIKRFPKAKYYPFSFVMEGSTVSKL